MRFLEDQDRRSLKGLLSTQKGCLAAARMVQETELLAQFKTADLERTEGGPGGGEEGKERRREE